jgi:hypothetical protein
MGVVVVFNSTGVQALIACEAEHPWLYSNLCSVPLHLGMIIYSESDLKWPLNFIKFILLSSRSTVK